jgi:hypothetical protein
MDQSNQQTYICPMHPEVVSDKLGRCPKCGMDLVLKGSKPMAMTHEYKRPLKDFLPIIVIFSSILVFTAIALLIRGSWSTTFAMRMMMGSFFLIFGSFKVFNLNAFAEAYSTYDILAKRSRVYSLVYPFIELTLAVLYLANIGGIPRDIFTFVLMTVSSVGVIQKIREKEVIPCACLGMVFKIPMTWVTLIEDVLMAMEAFFMAVMTIGLPLAYANSSATLAQTLKIHTTAEWVRYSDLGHWIIGGFIVIVLLGSIFNRFKVRWGVIFTKYLAPLAFILLGLGLSVVDVIYHSIQSDPKAVWYLLTHISQFQQHFLGGIFFLIAGIAEWVRTRGGKQWLSYVTPVAVFLIGTIFFFHQQLGIIPSVRDAMNWHMFFGAMLVIGATFRVLDLLFFEEQKWFFTIWIIALLINYIGSGRNSCCRGHYLYYYEK